MTPGICQRNRNVRESNRSGTLPTTSSSRSLHIRRSLHSLHKRRKLCRPGRLYRLGTLCMLCSRRNLCSPRQLVQCRAGPFRRFPCRRRRTLPS